MIQMHHPGNEVAKVASAWSPSSSLALREKMVLD